MEIPEKVKISLVGIGGVLFGFFAGGMSFQDLAPSLEKKQIRPEISIVSFEKISGDGLFGEISGPVRVLWGGNTKEGDGKFQIPLGQIPNENDIKFQTFPYTGNAKTMKFYPSDSYFARGVEVRYRRFFRTKSEAISAGFLPTKSIK